MILDAENEFSDGQAVTATAISTNVMDLGAAPVLRDLGAGEPIYLIVAVIVTTTSGGSTTLVVSLESDSTADLATSATVHFTTAAIAKATLVAGFRIAAFALPLEETYERFLGVRYTVAVANFTAGNFDAFLTKDVEKYTSLPDALA